MITFSCIQYAILKWMDNGQSSSTRAPVFLEARPSELHHRGSCSSFHFLLLRNSTVFTFVYWKHICIFAKIMNTTNSTQHTAVRHLAKPSTRIRSWPFAYKFANGIRSPLCAAGDNNVAARRSHICCLQVVTNTLNTCSTIRICDCLLQTCTAIPRLTKIIRSGITFVSRNVMLSGVSLLAVSNVNNPVNLVGLPYVMWSANFFVTHIQTEKISSWNGPTVHVCCFMLARASPKTFVSRIHIC